jgi:SAM-dependent methyltransferase
MDVSQATGLRLNIGCGNRRLAGWVGIDIETRPGADIVAPADQIPLPDGCAREILSIHLLEHVYEWDVPAVLAEWARLLAPGGRLVMEMPDLRKCARNLLDGLSGKHPDQMHLWGIFGDATLHDRRMMHRSGWWFDRLAPIVCAAGFSEVREAHTQYHPVGRVVRDFRLEAIRAPYLLRS